VVKRVFFSCVAVFAMAVALARPAAADSFFFSTGLPDGRIATLSSPATPARSETETADDFILSQPTTINHATFYGLLPSGTPLSSISGVEIEFYHVFPADSTNPPSMHVPTRTNSPSDTEIASATRDSAAATLSFTPTLLGSFAAANSVVNGIFAVPPTGPGSFTGGEGPVTGEEVLIDVSFTVPILLDANHYFFRPEVGLTDANFLWLSAPKPIVAPGTPFTPDLQSWIRNGNISPDWLRIGTDITGQGPFNAAFSLSGETVPTPEPSSLLLFGSGLLGLGPWVLRRIRVL
jgi:PEP-CTERM motif